ncbi:Sec1-binding region of Mso1 [Teratosphaeria destructans]|uniref:Sec1-binding region of Mso1 n=1 Tax=Teratosphaeria destructans TaxID=418781 RepID=A0A9W7SVH7_9PEZI|nr:Sec1-binding region of Mso1 [Teratosphaeria destructans]
MSSYLSNILTQTTSKYNSLKRTLLTSEDDGDTEDDSHISRVLRAYYTEKGRQFPPWLPPDPNDRRAITPQPYGQQNSGYFANVGGKSQVASVQNQGVPRSSLSDLWDAPSAQNNGPMQPQSLRAGRRPMAPAQNSSTLAPPQARPLPSQRAGSYQTMQPQQAARPIAQPSPPSSSGGVSAQERLKARLRGGGSRPVSPGLGPVANSYDQQQWGR